MTNNIIQGYPTPQKEHYKVCVRSCTYNQSKYIEDCLNGVAMQKTDFPFVHHVIDDCSTDGEQGVINAWIERECDMDNAEYYDNDICTITLAKHKLSPSYTIAAYFLKQNMNGNPKKRELFNHWQNVCTYIALCEGDDYWIDPLKLYRQVEYMDKHQECSLCFHNAVIFWENENKPSTIFNNFVQDQNVTVRQIVSKWIIPTASIVCRPERVKRPAWADKIYSGDMTMALLAASTGTVYSMRNVMSVYRRNDGGVSTAISKDPNAFGLRQQQLLYEEFNKYTNNKFEEDIRPTYERNYRRICHVDRIKKGGLIKFFSYFIFYFQKHILKNI